MHTFRLTTAVLLMLVTTTALATQIEPTGTEVIQKFIDVTGGKDAYAKLKTRVSTGTISMAQQKMSGQITLYQKAPNLTRVTGNVGPVTFDRGFDGSVAYECNSAAGSRIIEGDERIMMEMQALSNPIENLTKMFTDVENLGVEQLDDREAYKLELTLKSGEKFTEWFDTESGLLSQLLMSMDSPAGKLEITIIMSDWRETGGVKVPFKTLQKIEPFGIEQTIEFTKIESNIEIPPEKLEPPEDVKDMLKEMQPTAPTTQPDKK